MKRKHGFTIIELVIVIAVIGVLSAILIPTISIAIYNAKMASDLSLVKNMNTCLEVDNKEHKTMYNALAAIKGNGIEEKNVKNLALGDEQFVAWDRNNDRFVLVSKANDSFVYPKNDGDEKGIIDNYHDYFAIFEKVPASSNQKYSIYLSEEAKISTLTVSVGFDAGNNNRVTSLTYDRHEATSSRDVLIRTNTGTACTYYGYVDGEGNGDSIYHYGEAGSQRIDCANLSFHEHGGATENIIDKGHYVQESGSIVAVVEAKATNGDVDVELLRGSIQGTVKNTNESNEVSIKSEEGVTTVSLEAKTDGGNLKVDLASQPTYSNTCDKEEIQEEKSVVIRGVGDGVQGKENQEAPASHIICPDGHDYILVAGYSVKVCSRCGAYEYSEPVIYEDNHQHQEEEEEELPTENTYTINRNDSGEMAEPVKIHEHNFGGEDDVIWTWEDNIYDHATAYFHCIDEDCHQSETVIIPDDSGYITNSITKEPTCTETGERTYVAHLTHHGIDYSNTNSNKESISANGHTPGGEIEENRIEPTCTGAGSYDGVVYCSVCGEELSRTPRVIPATGHSWGINPEWSWTGDKNNGFSAGATFTCENDSNHTHMVNVASNDIVSQEGSGEDVGRTIYTATINFNDKEYIDTIKIDTFATFNTVLENADNFLYRVGNQNAIKLGSLFEANDEVNAANVNITISELYDSGVTGTYTKNNDWTQSTIKFNGTGPVSVFINEGSGSEFELILEVINAKNVTQFSELANDNCVLLNDITMSSGSNYYLNNSRTLYGNGFTFDVRNGAHQGTGKESNNYVICLAGANLDNIKIVGKVYTDYGATTSDDYNFPCVLISGGENVVANSYISNCASPVKAVNSAKVRFENTVLKGGSFCNLNVGPNAEITIDGLTTINQVENNDAADNGTKIIGLGILVYYESTTGNEKITILNDSLHQYNWVANNQSSNTVSIAHNLYGNLFSINANYIYSETSTLKWVNTGILSLLSSVGSDNITTPTGYGWQNVSMLGQSGKLCTKLASAPQSASDSMSFEQSAFVPKFNINKTGDTYSEKILIISFSSEESYVWNCNKLSATANGKSLETSISVNGSASYNANGNTITFTEGGEYVITCSYTVEDNYRINNGIVEKYSKSYSASIPVSVTVTSSKATISFSGYNTTEYKIGEKTYLLLTDATTTVDNIGTITETVDGQQRTVTYPVIDYKGSMSSTVYWPIFGDIVTIEDDGVTYGSSTTAKPNNLTCYWGKYYGQNTKDGKTTTYNKACGGTAGSDVYKDVFNCERGGAATVQIETKDNQVAYSQSVSNSNRKNFTFVVKYCYQSGGYTFYYYIGYKEGTSGGGGCFATGTLITMADGTQKEIENIKIGDMVLTWNFHSGQLEAQPVSMYWFHGYGNQEIINLDFSDGKHLEVVTGHGFLHLASHNFVFIDKENYKDYIGEEFVVITDDGSYKNIVLMSAYLSSKTTGVYSLRTAYNDNALANNLISLTIEDFEGITTCFDIMDNLTYDENQIQQLIDEYGLYTYEEWESYMPKYIFEMFNCKYYKIYVGLGILEINDFFTLLDGLYENLAQ